MINDINQEIEELKKDDKNYLKYIECFCEVEKVIEENSPEYQELKRINESEFDDEY